MEVKSIWISFVLAWQFFTILPAPKVSDPSESDMRRSALFLPVVGLFLGAILVGVRYVLHFVFPIQAATFIAIVVYTAITGALHVDGLMDTFDAIGSRKEKDAALEIMKDSRVGAMGAIVAVVLLAGKWIALMNDPIHLIYPIVVVPVLSRLAMLWSMVTSPPAKPAGLGQLFAGKARPLHVALISAAVFIVSLFFIPIITVAALFVAFYLIIMFVPAHFTRKFGGMTGDTFGALSEITEWLLFFIVLACASY